MPELKEPRGRPTKVGDTTIRPIRKKCVIPGCLKNAVSWWLLLPGGPAFCSEHYTRATEYGADMTPYDTPSSSLSPLSPLSPLTLPTHRRITGPGENNERTNSKTS